MQKILFNGAWVDPESDLGAFMAENPSNRETLDARTFPSSTWAELTAMVAAGAAAADEMSELPGGRLADFLESYADGIAGAATRLARAAHEETGLPVTPRLLQLEIPRTVDQLRQAAAAARLGTWARPTIDTAANLRSVHGALGGPVVIFGPNNFPFAFNGIAGGDFAAAIAAGNPVIAKAHPSHPFTTQLLAELAIDVVHKHNLPAATVQLFYGTDPELGLRLVAHSKVAAVAFTGSRPGGRALKTAADQAGTPIYLEMSSVNPVFVMPGALHERGAPIAAELQGSCMLAAGQFCTKPGLIVVQAGEEAEAFTAQLCHLFSATDPGILLGSGGLRAVTRTVDQLVGAGAQILTGGRAAQTQSYGFQPTLLRVTGDMFLQTPRELQNEAFGPVALLIVARDDAQMLDIASQLEGGLTGSIYSDTNGGDDRAVRELSRRLRPKVGRLLNDKAPTGVAVSAAMNHGGPFPATGHPGFTAVGIPASIVRFSALHCYDHVRSDRLPPSLRDQNPNGRMLRLIDGQWTTDDISARRP